MSKVTDDGVQYSHEEYQRLAEAIMRLQEAARNYLRHGGDVAALELASLVGIDPEIALAAGRRGRA